MTVEPESPSSVFADWKRERYASDQKSAPPVLWHYTSASGLIGILQTNKLYASRSTFLNDSLEISHGLGVLRSTLFNLGSTGYKPVTKRFIRGISKPGIIERHFAGTELTAYVACFCGEKDLLSQWRGYQGQGAMGGYALEFTPPGAFASWAFSAPDRQHLELQRIVYKEPDQYSLALDLVRPLIDYLDCEPESNNRQKTFGAVFTEAAFDFACRCKHPSFAAESEWRIIHSPRPSQRALRVKHRESRGLLIPYVELDLPAGVGGRSELMPITTIMCGPNAEMALKLEGACSLTHQSQFADTIRVIPSKVPLRS